MTLTDILALLEAEHDATVEVKMAPDGSLVAVVFVPMSRP